MDSTNAYLAGIAISFVGSCFFSFTETALTALPGIQTERIMNRGGWFNDSLRRWLDKPDRLLATILVCNTFLNTQIAILSTNLMREIYPEHRVADAFFGVFVTILLLIFGEIGPKVVARAHAEKSAPYVCRLLLGFDFVLYPLTVMLTSTVAGLLKMLGIRINDQRLVTHSDIEYLVSVAERQGTMEHDKTQILSSVFEFSKRRVKDIMIPRDKISALSINAGLVEVLDFVRQENHSRYPVYNANLDRIVGFFHARDLFGILKSYAVKAEGFSVVDSFSLRTCLRRAFFVSEQAMISRVLSEMKSNRIHLAIVKDEWGNVVGLVTLEDILEEVFGEINDEHDDQSSKPVVDLYSSGIEVEGSELLVDLKTNYGIEMEPAESYATINGFLMHYAGHQQLSNKTVIIWNNYVFTILSVKDGEVERVRITEIPEERD